jgi:hypothetical protein
MPTADIISITTRRNALRLGAAATVAGLITPAIAAPNGDAELLDLCHHLSADSFRLRQHDAACAGAFASDPRMAMDDGETDSVLDSWYDTLDQIIAIPAATGVGIRAKATALGHALMQCAFVDTDLSVDEQGENYERLAMSLVRDLAAVPG